jgi:hypothetical protein
MIIFDKIGKPSKAETEVLNKIKTYIDNLTDDEKEKYSGRKIKPSELNDFYYSMSGTKNNNLNSKPMETKQTVDDMPDFFTPFEEDVVQRSYNVDTNQTYIPDAPEPEFNNTIKLDDEPKAESGQEQKQEPKGNPVTNDDFNELDNKDKKIAAKQLAQGILDGYEQLHLLGVHFAKYDENKLAKAVRNGEIDPDMSIPVDAEGTRLTAPQFIQSFNENAEKAISYDPEFGDKVRPALERVLIKKGWGMTDEQYLLMMFAKDIAIKTTMIFGLKKQANMFMDEFREMQREKIEMMRRQNINTEAINPDKITKPKPDSSYEQLDDEL